MGVLKYEELSATEIDATVSRLRDHYGAEFIGKAMYDLHTHGHKSEVIDLVGARTDPRDDESERGSVRALVYAVQVVLEYPLYERGDLTVFEGFLDDIVDINDGAHLYGEMFNKPGKPRLRAALAQVLTVANYTPHADPLPAQPPRRQQPPAVDPFQTSPAVQPPTTPAAVPTVIPEGGQSMLQPTERQTPTGALPDNEAVRGINFLQQLEPIINEGKVGDSETVGNVRGWVIKMLRTYATPNQLIDFRDEAITGSLDISPIINLKADGRPDRTQPTLDLDTPSRVQRFALASNVLIRAVWVLLRDRDTGDTLGILSTVRTHVNRSLTKKPTRTAKDTAIARGNDLITKVEERMIISSFMDTETEDTASIADWGSWD